MHEQKHLGVVLSDDMKWTKHINLIRGRAHKKIGLLFRSSMYLSTEQKSLYYKMAIRPLVEYASVLFDNCTKQNMLCLEGVQRRAALVCTGAMKRTESMKVLSDLGWETLENRRQKAKLILFYKIKNGLVPEYLTVLLPPNIEISNRFIFRHAVKKPFFKSRLKAYETSYFPSTSKSWELLPSDVVTSKSICSFKKCLSTCTLFCRTECDKKSYLFPYCSGYYGRILNQIRYELSQLRSHLFTYNIIDNPMCPNCYHYIETTKHFFKDCSSNVVPRIKLLNKLSALLNECIS